jgi:hypothetical protein
VPAICLSLAATSISAELPSGKQPTTAVRLLISLMILSRGLLVLIRLQCSWGKPIIAQRLSYAFPQNRSHSSEFHPLTLFCDFVLLRVDRLEHRCHFLYLPLRDHREHISVEMYNAPLPRGFGIKLPVCVMPRLCLDKAYTQPRLLVV